jgi:hypothetical protein
MTQGGPGPSGRIPIVEPNEHAHMTAAVATTTQNAVFLYRFRVSQPLKLTKAAFCVGAANGNVDMGIYTSADLVNFTRVASAGSTAAAGTNTTQGLTFTAPYVVVPGVDYFLAFATDSATITVAQAIAPLSAPAEYTKRGLRKLAAWSSGLPASISTPVGVGLYLWLAAKE